VDLVELPVVQWDVAGCPVLADILPDPADLVADR